MKTSLSSPSPDLELALDVGHSSIGWGVLQSVGRESARAANPSVNTFAGVVKTLGRVALVCPQPRRELTLKENAIGRQHRLAAFPARRNEIPVEATQLD